MRRVLITLLIALTTTIVGASPTHAAGGFASPAFAQQWKRGEAIATNFWGPLDTAHDPMKEPYAEAPGGQRVVQYFDKARMEVTPDGQLTNGLLAVELITGRLQLGDATFEQRRPATIPPAGDLDNTFPMYADLQRYMAPAPGPVDQALTIVGPGGSADVFTREDGDPAVAIAVSDRVGRDVWHNVPQAFSQFREQVGVGTVGLAITEPVWVSINVGGVRTAVLIQAFERRVLTYTPTNPPDYQVEFGNIGQHYFQWRYPNGLPPSSVVIPNPKPAQDFSTYADTWARHGFALVVRTDGTADASWRIYRSCDDDPTPPCDQVQGNQILDGGTAHVTFTAIAPGGGITGIVQGSTDPDTLMDGPVSFKLLPYYDMALLTAGPANNGIVLCGSHFADLAPPDVVQNAPCGA
ncbi:MAG: hypothetical protein ACR2M3_10925 [Thermomicrobiales bacterium]